MSLQTPDHRGPGPGQGDQRQAGQGTHPGTRRPRQLLQGDDEVGGAEEDLSQSEVLDAGCH